MKGPFPSDIRGAVCVSLRLEILIAFLCTENETSNPHPSPQGTYSLSLSGPTLFCLGCPWPLPSWSLPPTTFVLQVLCTKNISLIHGLSSSSCLSSQAGCYICKKTIQSPQEKVKIYSYCFWEALSLCWSACSVLTYIVTWLMPSFTPLYSLGAEVKAPSLLLVTLSLAPTKAPGRVGIREMFFRCNE